MELETTQTSTTAKLPMLKQGDYEIWRLRINQYFQIQDYALRDVIENGNSFVPVTQTTTAERGAITTTISSPVTAKENIKKKNNVKTRSMLLMALPNEHLMTFNQYKDAKSLFTAIVTRFGGNKATKKTQKTLLKQMYENFSAPSTYLPSEWNTHVLVWRNKPDLDTMSIDDLYNNFKIVEHEVKVTTSSNSSSQNMDFVSSPSNNNTNEVHTAYGVSTASTQSSTTSTQVNTASSQTSIANLSGATVYAFLANQSNGSQLVHEDLEQIHEDDLKEIDLKWQLALLSMRAKRGPRNQDNRNMYQDISRRAVHIKETPPKAMVAIDGVGFDWSYMVEDEVPTNMAFMTFSDFEPKVERYGPKTCEIESKNASKDITIEVKEYLDAPLVKDRVADNKDCLVESPVVVEKKTVVPTIAKVEANCNYHQRKRVVYGNNYTRVTYNNSTRKTYPSAHRKIAPRAVSMKTGLRPLNTARPKAVNTARPSPKVVNVVRTNQETCPISQISRNSIEDMLPLGEEQMVAELLNRALVVKPHNTPYELFR
nr:ribonuclease H-like domain-containing protein [Tanacetum cinerariifolium]